MKNNQFRAYLDKYIKKTWNNTTVLTVDKDSSTRNVYIYTNMKNKYLGECLGSIVFYFMNEGIHISYSRSNKRVCKLTNLEDERQFDYCELKKAKRFIQEAMQYFLETLETGCKEVIKADLKNNNKI